MFKFFFCTSGPLAAAAEVIAHCPPEPLSPGLPLPSQPVPWTSAGPPSRPCWLPLPSRLAPTPVAVEVAAVAAPVLLVAVGRLAAVLVLAAVVGPAVLAASAAVVAAVAPLPAVVAVAAERWKLLHTALGRSAEG